MARHMGRAWVWMRLEVGAGVGVGVGRARDSRVMPQETERACKN